ncbi:MAG: hypothetical protein LC799_10760, partial [Actinobacteria bacterium]|nr:hypothetical protein [Actinomycetota bacterium]
ALFDRLGTGFTLVDLSGTEAGQGVLDAAQLRGVPLRHLPIEDPAVRSVWERDLVLVRPDQHVAWRGLVPPARWDAVLDRVTGVDDAQGTTALKGRQRSRDDSAQGTTALKGRQR